ncbi:MAG: hypothetical protein J6T16_02675 [Opitutales bacterium]|nr:hypothetical protein [Opitutales bacterium]
MGSFKRHKLYGLSVLLMAAAWAGLFVCLVYAFYEMFFEGDSSIHAENHFLENAQVAVCAIEMLVFLAAAFFSGENAKAIPLFFAVLAFAFILREVDVERLDVPEICKILGSGWGRNIIVSLMFAAVFAAALLNFRLYFWASLKFMRTKTFYWGIAAAAVLFASHIAERAHSLPHNEFWEETLELAGYALFLIAATFQLPRPLEERL